MRGILQCVMSLMIVCSLVGSTLGQAQPDRPTGAEKIEGSPPPQNMSWYPHEIRPPFLGDLYELEDTVDVVYAGSATFTAGDPPAIPEALRKSVNREQFEPGYFILHFEADLRPVDKSRVDELTGAVTRADGTSLARWYLPNNAVVAWVSTVELLEQLEEEDRMDWVGRYEPAYKLDPTIGSAPLTSPHRVGRLLWQLNVDIIPGHRFASIESALAGLGVNVLQRVDLRGASTYDQQFLVVSATTRQITAMAAIEGIRMIQESGDGPAIYDLSGGGKLQNRQLAKDDEADSPIVSAATFPLWLTNNLQGQGQLIGVVDTSFDWNNAGTSGCNFGYPDTSINNYGMAVPNLARVAISSVGSGGVNFKIPLADLLGGATLQGSSAGEHGAGVAGAALADFYGNNDTKWWEHDPDTWDSWSPTNYSGLLGPGIAHEAQLYATPALDSSGGFRWESPGEFPTNMSITLNNMAAAGVSTTVHSLGIVESANTYTQTSVAHDTAAFDNPNMLQFIAAGNDGAGSNKLSSQAVVKNAMTVGASDDVLKPEDRATFSSTGPRFDGGLKPDIMAPGTDTFARAGGVQSQLILPESNGTSSASCSYQYTSGTSFSAPIAAGAGALVHQYYEEGRYLGLTPLNDASAALIKATLVNAGHRLTGANLGDGSFPNDYQGWGEPDMSAVLDFGAGSRRLIAQDVAGGAGFTSSGDANDVWGFNVNGSVDGLKVTLAWTDEPGSTGSGKKLINDLHLIVTSPGGAVYRGNVINGSTGLSTTGGSADTLNNLENVILSSPGTGAWTATVDPGAGNYSVGQGYALVITGNISEGTPPAAPVADFSASPTSGEAPVLVSFSDLSSGTVSSWAWTFGDGGSSTAQNPTHTYTVAGTYNVSLTATGPGGSDGETKNGYITITAPPPAPVAEFSGSPTSGTAPLLVNFSDLSSGSVTSWAWTFGDGGTSTAQNPSHTYTSAGNFTVTLTATGPGGSDGETKASYISVSAPPVAPTAQFSGSPTSGNTPLVVSFSDLSSGDVTGWSWTFGDGATSTAQNPAHTYTVAGTYDVTLTASGPAGSDGETKLGYITVGSPPAGPTAEFSGTPTSGQSPLLVSFTDLSSGSVTSWSWTFGDGGSSTAQNPSHTYTAAGSFSVTLTATGPGGSDGVTKNGYITVTAPPVAPTAEFSGSPTSGTNPLLVSFTDLSTGDVTGWSWTFGDGGTSTAQSPTHTYTAAGSYDVSLTATGPGGSDGVTKTGYITVSDPPTGGSLWYMSFTSGTSVPGVGTVADEDVVTYDPATGIWERIFDGSDVGVKTDVNALHVLDDGTLVLSFNAPLTIPGLVGGPSGESVDDSDLVLFSFTQQGNSTAGSFQFVFDGSDVGMTSNGEDIDGVYEFPGGGLGISTVGSAGVTGLSGVRDEDVMLFTATQFGATTSGSFSALFDGSDVGFNNSSSEDLSAVCFDLAGDLLFSTVGNWSASGGAGADEDVGRFSGVFGASTSGTAALELDLSALGISTAEDIDGLCYRE